MLGAARGPGRGVQPPGAPSPWSAPTCSLAFLAPGRRTRLVQVLWLVIAIDGKTVRGAKKQGREGPAPGRGAGARHRARLLGQVAAEEKSNSIPPCASCQGAHRPGAGFTIDAMHTQHYTPRPSSAGAPTT